GPRREAFRPSLSVARPECYNRPATVRIGSVPRPLLTADRQITSARKSVLLVSRTRPRVRPTERADHGVPRQVHIHQGLPAGEVVGVGWFQVHTRVVRDSHVVLSARGAGGRGE